MFKLFALVVGVSLVTEARASAEVVKNMSLKFLEHLDACMDELNIEDPNIVIYDLKSFWKEDFVPSTSIAGCAMHCLATKLELIDEDGYLHHQNMEEFALKQGTDVVLANEKTAAEITKIVYHCLDSTIGDACNRSEAAAQCVKQKLQELGWAPPADLMFEEILSDRMRRK